MMYNEEQVNDILDILGIKRKSVSLYVKMDLDRYIQNIIDERQADAYCIGFEEGEKYGDYPQDFYD